jgi:glyoxylase-like metal-dependent hydrolase (beta-lactamase superfamily II)
VEVAPVSLTLLHHRVVGPLQCNCYIVGDEILRRAIVIDPGGDPDELLGVVAEQGLEITAIVATHAHFDHLLAAEALRAGTGAPFLLHRFDEALLSWMQESGRLFLGAELPPPPEVDTWISEGDRVVAGAAELEVLHTPGHSPGSISLASADALFSGDTLFAGSFGRVDLPGGSPEAMVESLDRLRNFDDGLRVLPGHGAATTVGRERPWLDWISREGRLPA